MLHHIAPAACALAEHAELTGEWAGAVMPLRNTRALAQRLGLTQVASPFERAHALADADDEEALLIALDLAVGLGADPLVARLRARLRSHGVQRVPRGPRATTRANPAGLTARQLDVLALLHEGLTNAEIAERLVLSVKTVNHHVSAVLDKLGVDNRHDAVRVAARTR